MWRPVSPPASAVFSGGLQKAVDIVEFLLVLNKIITLVQMAPNKQELLKRIKESGFPLELRISAFLQRNSYSVAHAVYYVDKDEDKAREIDLRALKSYVFKIGGTDYQLRLCFLIECKKSTKPWVIFSSEKTIEDYSGMFPSCSVIHNRGEAALRGLDFGERPFSGFILPRRGRSFFEPFKGNRDRSGTAIYTALVSSCKAAIATRDSNFAAGGHVVCFYYPVVVFEGCLFEAYLEDGEIILREANTVLVTFYYQSSKYKDASFTIPVLTENRLSVLCQSADSDFRSLQTQIKKNPILRDSLFSI